MTIHFAGVAGLILIFILGGLRSVNLGALALVMTALLGATFSDEPASKWFAGFPVELLILLVAVTWLFAIAARNGTIDWIVNGAARLVGGRRALVPWIVFFVAALPTTAGALGSAGVALIAPVALRIAERYDLDRRMIGLMVLHGAACGNFSPLNVLGAIVNQAVARSGTDLSPATLFLANVAFNVVLGAVIFVVFGGMRLARSAPATAAERETAALCPDFPATRLSQSIVTVFAILAVAIASLCFDLGIGMLALFAAVALSLLFPRGSKGAEGDISWSVALLVCGIVTYVAAMQRFGTVDAIGHGIAGISSPLLGALLICAVGAVTSAFASSAGILGAMMMLAVPFISQGGFPAAGFVMALAISVTVVDSSPFSTAGALVVANARQAERDVVFRGLLIWGGAMVLTAPLVTWLIFIVGG